MTTKVVVAIAVVVAVSLLVAWLLKERREQRQIRSANEARQKRRDSAPAAREIGMRLVEHLSGSLNISECQISFGHYFLVSDESRGERTIEVYIIDGEIRRFDKDGEKPIIHPPQLISLNDVVLGKFATEITAFFRGTQTESVVKIA